MRQDPKRNSEKSHLMNAAAISNETQWMLHQLALPIEPTDTIKARRERAIRRAGLSPAKGARLWYGQACAILAEEFFKIANAYRKHVEIQETALAQELETLRALKAAREQRGLWNDYEMGGAEASHGVVAARENVAVD